MELKDRKYIKNTKNLPGYESGLLPQLDNRGDAVSIPTPNVTLNATTPNFNQNFTTNASGTSSSRWANFDPTSAITGVTGFAQSINNANQFNTTSDDYINKYGFTNQSVGDIGYQRYNDINKSAEMNIVKQENTRNLWSNMGSGAAAGAGIGAAIGSIVPGIGTLAVGGIGAGVGALTGLITGLFGGSSRKRKAERAMQEAQRKVDNMNTMNRSSALSASLQQDQAMKYGDTRSQSLFGYKCGKSPKYINGKPVYSAYGPVNAKPDSKVSKGEVAIDVANGSIYRIPTGPRDTALFAGGKDPNIGIVTNKYGLSDYAMVDPIGALNIQSALKDAGILKKNSLGYKNGKMCKYNPGKMSWLPSAMTNGLTSLVGIEQYLRAKGNEPYKPNTYVANPYAGKALSTLAGLRTNMYPIVQQLRNKEAANNYATIASGGLSTAQKNLARQSGLLNTQNSIASALLAGQEQDNKYRSTYADALLTEGARESINRMTAMRNDIDAYMRSRASKLQNERIGQTNVIAGLQQMGKDWNAINQFNNMYSLYAAEVENKKEALKKGLG